MKPQNNLQKTTPVYPIQVQNILNNATRFLTDEQLAEELSNIHLQDDDGNDYLEQSAERS